MSMKKTLTVEIEVEDERLCACSCAYLLRNEDRLYGTFTKCAVFNEELRLTARSFMQPALPAVERCKACQMLSEQKVPT